MGVSYIASIGRYEGYLRLSRVGSHVARVRVGVPNDVARVALFCASDLSMLMTGSTLLVDAGDVAL